MPTGDGRRVVVAGASRGIGLAFCEVYAERGDGVMAICRSAPAELRRPGIEVLEGVDFTDDAACAALTERVPGPIDVLVYNAGVNVDAPGLWDIEVDALRRAFDVNTLGAVRVVLALLPALADGARIMFLGTGAPALNVRAPSAGNYGYRMSKAALGSFAFGLARDLRRRGAIVLVAGPGPVDTDMLRAAAAAGRTTFDPADAPGPHTVAESLVERLDELTAAESPAWHEDPAGTPVRL